MRYQVGQIVPFILIRFQEKDGYIWNRTGYPVFMYHPLLREHNVLNVTVKVLTCIEHHKVPWDQDPDGERKYDGYVFIDEDGKRWLNQYTAASYGQTCDARDWQVTRDYAEFKAEHGITEAVNGITYANENMLVLGMQDAMHLLDDTKNYIDGYNSRYLEAGPDTERMRFYLACLVQLVEGATNARVQFHCERNFHGIKFYDAELIDSSAHDETVLDGLAFSEARDSSVAENIAKGML